MPIRRSTISNERLAAAFAAGGVALAAIAAAALLEQPSPWVVSVVWGLGAGGFFLGAAALNRLRRRAAALEAEAQQRIWRMTQLAGIAEHLGRLRDPAEVAARAELMARSLLECDEAEVALGLAAAEPAGQPGGSPLQQSVRLLAADGAPIGQVAVRRRAGPPFTTEDKLVLDQLVRAVAAAIENAGLLAESMRARSEIELILGTISDGMYVLDGAWRVRHVNSAALRYLERTREQVVGATLWQLFPDLPGSAFGDRLEEAMLGSHDLDFTALFPPLKAWFETRCYPFEGGLTVYFRDVTAQRETEERLRQSQKLEALGQLTGGIAHDVNNLLTVMLGNFEMLATNAEERGEPDGSDHELAEAGLRAGASASQLMRRLLAFSRRQPLSPQVVDIAALLSSLDPLLRRTIGETVSLYIAAEPGLWLVLVDPAELENAILNLALNARDAMPGGGQLAIEAANVAIDRVYAAVSGLDRTGDYIMISVADSGIGMAREVQGRAFEPFFTTKQPGKGTGLGLSMVYGFVKQSGGHVMIDSEIGQGTILRLYLPRTTAQAAEVEIPGAWQVHGGSQTILLVEDNDMVRGHTEAMLRGLGYCVLAAADGAEALLLLQEGVRPDLLLTDVVLPGGMTGREVADSAAAVIPGLRVLFTSGYSGNVLLEGGRISPGVELISKPFRRSELAARVRTQLAGVAWPGFARTGLLQSGLDQSGLDQSHFVQSGLVASGLPNQ